MKKLLFLLLLGVTSNLWAQRHHLIGFRRTLREHQLFIELNTNLGKLSPSATSIAYSKSNGSTSLHMGGEVGYFLIEKFAVKFGLGYHNVKQNGIKDQSLSYKAGFKYYFLEQITLGIDYSALHDNGYTAKSIGSQVGYALHLTESLTVEPTARYEKITTNTKDDIFSLNIGFVLFF